MSTDIQQSLYLLNSLIKLKDYGILDDHFISSLYSLSENYHQEELKQKVDHDIHQFIDFVKKNLSLSPKNQQLLLTSQSRIGKPVRIFMDGCFDLMHSGHFNALRQAKQLGDYLVVGVISSKEITAAKGPPVMDIEERTALVRACKWVDEVVENVAYNPSIELIDKINCQFVAHGDDLAIGADGQDSYHEIKKAGRMRTFKRTEGVSTTDIVGRLLLMTKQHHFETGRLRKLSGDGNLTSSNIQSKVEKEAADENLPKMKLLQTTRRIRQFSTGKEPKPNDRIVYIDGSFDLLHIGHIKILQKAKEIGDFLIVGIHDDDTINKHKGSNYPVLNLQERVLNVLAIKFVDEVIIGAPWKLSYNMIKNLNIQYVVEGTMTKFKEHVAIPDHLADDPYVEAKKLGIYRQVSSNCDLTTEKIVKRIIDNRMKYIEIQKIKEAKLANYYKTQDFSVKENQKCMLSTERAGQRG